MLLKPYTYLISQKVNFTTDILPTGNTSGLSLTDKIKKIRSYVFPLYFSGSSKGSIASNNSGTENGHAYVDLGLSVKWATCNVGATKPEEYGDYFAWGETQPKSTYNWSTYKWCNGSNNTQTKYNTNSSYGTVDNKTQLELSDDAARANWGGSWRMPTDAELTELRENCTWTCTTQNGVYGYKVTSKKSGYTNKSIFLPAAGYRYNSDLDGAGSSGDYWSSSLNTGYPYSAYGLYFYSGNVRSGRYYGQSVRPVCPQNITLYTGKTCNEYVRRFLRSGRSRQRATQPALQNQPLGVKHKNRILFYATKGGFY